MQTADKVLICSLAVFLFLPAISFADNLNDNPLVPLIDGEKENWRLEVSGMFPKASQGSTMHRRRLQDDNLPHIYSINVKGSSVPMRSYLYILTGEYFSPFSIWTVKFNNNILADYIHSESVGGNPRGDGEVDLERQTILFDVTGMVSQGENTITITDVDSPTSPYNLDGAILLNFYPSDEEHQIWVYHGVEYLEKKDRFDAISEALFEGVKEPSRSEATLYTVYQNGEQELDALLFNDNTLKDKDANYLSAEDKFGAYLLDGSHMIAKSFPVTDYLKGNNRITFSMETFTEEGTLPTQYSDIPIYPSIAILDVKLPPKPKVVVLANSIDLNRASDFIDFLDNRGLDVVQVNAEQFEDYKDEKFIVILGGPDAPEGVGNIVRESGMLSINAVDDIRRGSTGKRFMSNNPWSRRPGQIVWILAGSRRDQTVRAHKDHRNSIDLEIESSSKSAVSDTSQADPCPPSLDNPITHSLHFTQEDDRGEVYICDVVYSQGIDNIQVKLYNQGEDDVDLARYKLFDDNERFYRFSPYDENIIKSQDYLTLYPADIASELKLLSFRGRLSLEDFSENLMDMVEWNNVD
jgi:hypothetical protein